MASARDSKAFADMAKRLSCLNMPNTSQASNTHSNLFEAPRTSKVVMRDPRIVPQEQASVSTENITHPSQSSRSGHLVSPAITERDNSAGPTLFGSPEAIALARELQSSYGKSSTKRNIPGCATPVSRPSVPASNAPPVSTRITTSQRDNQPSIWAGQTLMSSTEFDAVNSPEIAKRIVADSSGYTFALAHEADVVKRPTSSASTNATTESKMSVQKETFTSPTQGDYTFKPAVGVQIQTGEVDRSGFSFKPAIEVMSQKTSSANPLSSNDYSIAIEAKKTEYKPVQAVTFRDFSVTSQDTQKDNMNNTIVNGASQSPLAAVPPHTRLNKPNKNKTAETVGKTAIDVPKEVKFEAFIPSVPGAKWKRRGGDPTLQPSKADEPFKWDVKDSKLNFLKSDVDENSKISKISNPENNSTDEHKEEAEDTVQVEKDKKHETSLYNDSAIDDSYPEIHMLKTLLASLEKREANVKDLNMKTLQLKLMLEGNHHEAAELKTTVQYLEKEAMQMKKDLSEQQKENASLKARIADFEGQSNKSTQLEVAVKRLEHDNTDLKATLSNKDSESASLKQQIEKLEEQAAYWTRKIEDLMKKEERRKFLGTTGSQVSFNIDVAHPGGIIKVQVTSAMKISELIRRIRADANIRPGMSANPTIVINEEQAGHMTTLGEYGVHSSNKPSVVFSYDVPSCTGEE